MKYPILLASVALAFTLPGCSQAERRDANAAENDAAPTETSQAYSGSGKVTAIDGDKVTIAHGPIEGIGWPAMTMGFTAPAGIAGDAQVGDEVDFSFRQHGSAYVLTSLRKRP